MAGKKQISAQNYSPENKIKTAVVDRYFRRRRRMGQHDKNWPDNDKKRDAFKNKRQFARISDNQKQDEDAKQDKTVNKYQGNIHRRQDIEEKIVNRIAGAFGGIDAGKITEDQTADDKKYWNQNQDSVRPVNFISLIHNISFDIIISPLAIR